MLRIIVLFLAALATRGAYGQARAMAETKSCCTTISSRTTLLAAASTTANAAGAKTAKDAATHIPNVSTKGWPAKPWPEGMVWIPGGEFSMGAVTNGHGSSEMPMASNDAEPVHRVFVDGFWIDPTAVTNEQFEKFVRLTSYVTIAERTPTREEFPTAPTENLVAGSVVFAATDHEVPLNDHLQWWT
jgi:formylglycine-generating enzyme required for sulfatase activity